MPEMLNKDEQKRNMGLKEDDEIYNKLKLIPNNFEVDAEDLEEIYPDDDKIQTMPKM